MAASAFLVGAFGVGALAIALGGAHIALLLAVSPILVAASALIVRRYGTHGTLVFRTALALAAFSLLQALPLPIWLVGAVNPQAAEIWRRALHPFGETVTWGALSLDPGASFVEAFKWFLYAVVALSASVAASRFGARAIALTLFACGLVVGACTVAHGVLEAQTVFGVYEPRFGASRWRIGPLLNPNNLAGYLNLAAFSGLGLSISSRFREFRPALVVGVVFSFGVVILTGSRAGVAAVAVGALAFLAFDRKRASREPENRSARSWVAVAIALSGALVLAVLGAQAATWRDLFQGEIGKLHMISRSLKMVLDFPVFGVGRGAFESISQAYGVASNHHVAAQPENLIAQWLVEWGVPVTLGLVTVTLRQVVRAGGNAASASSTRSGLKAGLVALLVQNAFDMGLELPAIGVAAACALGALDAPEPKAESVSERWRSPNVLVPAISLCGALLWLGSAGFGRFAVSDERLELSAAVQAAGSARGPEVAGLFTRLRRAMLRHPAEPHFARLGGTLALASRRADPMPWIALALERDLHNGRTRLLAARVLEHRGALGQAMTELRRAAELEPGLASLAGRLAAAWTRDPELLVRGAAQGTAGAEMLTNASRSLGNESTRAARRRCLEEAVRRDPFYAPARRDAIKLMIEAVERGTCPAEDCSKRGEVELTALERAAPASADSAILRARLAVAAGHGHEAAPVLFEACRHYSSWEKARCFLDAVRMMRADPSSNGALLASAAREGAESCDDVNPECANVLVEMGDALASTEAWGSALTVYERAVTVSPSPNAFLGLAAAASAIGQVARAQRALEHAEQLAGHGPSADRIRQRKAELRRLVIERAAGRR
ncbi:MAG: O-antigen ligase family protein [Myxococcota bacterium]|nr:O-antigen ligase family protein [Myxococcota bacterium]